MLIQSYCFKCEKTMTINYINLSEAEFWAAIDCNGDIEVMHASNDGDHRWMLNNQEKENLRKTRAKGLI